VRDTGRGSSQDDQRRLFTEFMQVNRNDIGTGLDLTICEHLI
jgi:signal transduction histidine kinase